MGRGRKPKTSMCRLVSPDHLLEIDHEMAGYVRLYAGLLNATLDMSMATKKTDEWWHVIDSRDFMRYDAAELLKDIGAYAPGLLNIRMDRRLVALENEWEKADLRLPEDHPVRMYDKRGEGRIPESALKVALKWLKKDQGHKTVLLALAKRRGIEEER